MSDLGIFLNDVYNRVSKLRENNEYRKCLGCDCYFGLLYYMKKELSKQREPRYQEMLENVSSTFDKRSEIKMHQCLGCNPCPPAEWTSELIRKLKE